MSSSVALSQRDPEPPLPAWDTKPDRYFTEKKALETACRLMDYWHRRGDKQVRAWAEKHYHCGYVVRSNLVGGLPPK